MNRNKKRKKVTKNESNAYRITDTSCNYDFLLLSYSNHAPVSYRFRDKPRKNTTNLSYPMCITPQLRTVLPSNFVTRVGTKLRWSLYTVGGENEFDRNVLSFRYNTWWTDRHMGRIVLIFNAFLQRRNDRSNTSCCRTSAWQRDLDLSLFCASVCLSVTYCV